MQRYATAIGFAAAMVLLVELCANAPLRAEQRAHRVNAVLIDEESSVRTSVSNRDAYRLRVTPRRGAAFEAIAIDSYPGYADALPLRGLAKDAKFSVKLIRTPYCDQAGVDGQDAVRCFAIERRSVRGPKSESDQWWK